MTNDFGLNLKPYPGPLARNTLYICRGLPGSGKTTWAKEAIRQAGFWVRRVNQDDLRDMSDNGIYSSEREFGISRMRNACITQLLLLGYTVISDDTNIAVHTCRELRTIADIAGASIVVVEFAVPVATCIERDAKRPKSVGRDVIVDMAVRKGEADLLLERSMGAYPVQIVAT